MNWPEVISDLETKREHLSIAIDVLKAYGTSLNGTATAPAQAQLEVAAPDPQQESRSRKTMGRARPIIKTVKVKKSVKGRHCAKHPEETQFYKNGQCRSCALAYQKSLWKKKQSEKAVNGKPGKPAPRAGQSPHEELDEIEDDFAGDGDELPPAPAARQFIWSKPTRCPKCSETTRLRRLADADPAKDAWIHPGPNCTIKIAHYKIKDDPKFVGASAAPPPRNA